MRTCGRHEAALLISRLPSTDSPATQKNAPEGISVSAPAISRREAYSSSAIGLPTGDVSTRQQVVPPPAPEPISPLKLIGLGLAVGVIPAVLLLWFAFASPTDTEAKVAELKVEIKKAPTEAIAPKIDEAKAEKERRAREKEQKAQALKEAEAKAKAQAERKAKEDEARRRRKEQQQQRMIARPAVKKRQSLRVKIGFPEKGLGGASSYLVDQGKTYDYAKLTNRFQNKKSPIDYRLTQSPGVGWRIDGIRHQPSSADQETRVLACRFGRRKRSVIDGLGAPMSTGLMRPYFLFFTGLQSQARRTKRCSPLNSRLLYH